ncbi:hypothetical protein [Campylobacter suis]|uniref:Vesicular transport factor Uso1p n=1 Tax=Campylobacter suis TaxID=2790657 RepID=A0ABN7K4W4_9BACT|nr:hypothetical protein [Campylobacter suis]CAD7287130.1 hypothetical protein LMG8286_00761 [Campylobacter suis]
MNIYKIVFVLILCLVVFFTLPFLNKNLGQSQQNEQITQKEYKIYPLKFSDLPQAEKERYINKDDLYEYGGYITPKSYSENFAVSEDNGTSILELLSQNKALVADNIDLGEKNLALIEKLEAIKSELENQKSMLNAKNEELLNRQESQHYENIQRLTKELNEVQKEGINSISNYEKRIAILENEMVKFRLDVDRNQSNEREAFTEFIRQSDENQTTLKRQNFELNNDIQAKKLELSTINTELNTLKTQLQNQQTELETMQINANKNIKDIQDGFAMQKTTLEDELSRKSNKIIDLENEIGVLKKELNASINLANITKTMFENAEKKSKELDSTLVGLLSENLDFNKTKKELELTSQNLMSEQNKTRSLDKIVSELSSENKELNSTIEIKNDTIAELMKSVNDLKNIVDIKNTNIRNLEGNATIAKDELIGTKSELEKLEKSIKVDARNYEILNLQITALKKELSNFKKDENIKTNESIKELEEQLRKNQALLKENNKTIESLTSQISKTSKDTMSSAEYYKRIEELTQDIEASLNNQDRLEDENANLRAILQTQTKPEVPKKLVFVEKFECLDMDMQNTPSQMCKNRLSEFLQRYNSNYIYEIIPIVDEKSFAMPYDAKKMLKKDELNTLNKYVNYGVGKERAMVAAGLIRDEFGDFARISISSEIVLRSSSRGFIIKAYR